MVIVSESDQRDLEGFIISKPKIQITQNKNPVKAKVNMVILSESDQND